MESDFTDDTIENGGPDSGFGPFVWLVVLAVAALWFLYDKVPSAYPSRPHKL